jgi:hypothetical protein
VPEDAIAVDDIELADRRIFEQVESRHSEALLAAVDESIVGSIGRRHIPAAALQLRLGETVASAYAKKGRTRMEMWLDHVGDQSAIGSTTDRDGRRHLRGFAVLPSPKERRFAGGLVVNRAERAALSHRSDPGATMALSAIF